MMLSSYKGTVIKYSVSRLPEERSGAYRYDSTFHACLTLSMLDQTHSPNFHSSVEKTITELQRSLR